MLSSSSLSLPFNEMLARMDAGDSSANGLFITGVLTTGIYCLPSCPARKPKAENVVFFATEDEALEKGLRACKRCRPDDFYAGRDPCRERLARALSVLDQDPSTFPDVAALAEQAGMGLSKLHELTQRYNGSTPAELIHASRVRVAKRLLLEGKVGATDAAFAVGYESVSAFYERFKRATGLTPRAFARQEAPARSGDGDP